jgi:hypothetical protein
MKPCVASKARMRGTFRPACCISACTCTKGAQFSLSGGASITMQLPPGVVVSMRR